jgi:hypothetical protein
MVIAESIDAFDIGFAALPKRLLPNAIACACHTQVITHLALAVASRAHTERALTLIAAETIYAIVGEALAGIHAAPTKDFFPDLFAAHLPITPFVGGIVAFPIETALAFIAAYVRYTII